MMPLRGEVREYPLAGESVNKKETIMNQQSGQQHQNIQNPSQRLTYKPLIYVSSPMKLDPYGGPARAIKAGLGLLSMGFLVVLPQTNIFVNQVLGENHISEEFWLTEVDRYWVMRCDALLRISGESKGADYEMTVAKEYGKPIFFSIQDILQFFGKNRERETISKTLGERLEKLHREIDKIIPELF